MLQVPTPLYCYHSGYAVGPAVGPAGAQQCEKDFCFTFPCFAEAFPCPLGRNVEQGGWWAYKKKLLLFLGKHLFSLLL